MFYGTCLSWNTKTFFSSCYGEFICDKKGWRDVEIEHIWYISLWNPYLNKWGKRKISPNVGSRQTISSWMIQCHIQVSASALTGICDIVSPSTEICLSGSYIGLVVLRINVNLAIFQPYLDLEAGDNQSMKIQVARPGIEPRSSCSPSQELNHSATTAPPYIGVWFQ